MTSETNAPPPDPFAAWPRNTPEEMTRLINAMQSYQSEKWTRERDAFKSEHDWSLKLFDAATANGQYAQKGAGTINAAGAAAILAFIGHLWTSKDAASVAAIPPLSRALTSFLIGMGLTAAGLGNMYIAQSVSAWQYQAMREKNQQKAKARGILYNCSNAVSILLGLGSFGAFVFGCLLATRVFLAGPTSVPTEQHSPAPAEQTAQPAPAAPEKPEPETHPSGAEVGPVPPTK